VSVEPEERRGKKNGGKHQSSHKALKKKASAASAGGGGAVKNGSGEAYGNRTWTRRERRVGVPHISELPFSEDHCLVG